MNRIIQVVTAMVVCLTAGCREAKKPVVPAAQPQERMVAPPVVQQAAEVVPPPQALVKPSITVETAREHFQQQVDVFFGGKRDKEMGDWLRLPPSALVEPAKCEYIVVGRVVQAVKSDGTPIKNVFLVSYEASGTYGAIGEHEVEKKSLVLIYDEATGRWSTTFKVPQ